MSLSPNTSQQKKKKLSYHCDSGTWQKAHSVFLRTTKTDLAFSFAQLSVTRLLGTLMHRKRKHELSKI